MTLTPFCEESAVSILAALMRCPAGDRVDTLAIVIKLFVEFPERFDGECQRRGISPATPSSAGAQG